MDYWKFKEWTKDGRDYAYIPNSVIEDGHVAKFYHDVCLSRSTNAREWPKEKQNQIKHPVDRLEYQLQHTMNVILDPYFWSEVKRPLRFHIRRDKDHLTIHDKWLDLQIREYRSFFRNGQLRFFNWFLQRTQHELAKLDKKCTRRFGKFEDTIYDLWQLDTEAIHLPAPDPSPSILPEVFNDLYVGGVSIQEAEWTTLQRNAASTRDFT
jgi:hypothetical protein